jgi:hypothetical protein
MRPSRRDLGLHADLIAGSDALSREDLKIGTPSLRYGN